MEIVTKLSAILLKTGTASSFEEIVLYLLDRVQRNETEFFQEFFDSVEHELIFGDRIQQESIIIDLLEALKNHASLRDVDYAIFENWLGPETHVAWRWLEKKWQGKTSLADSASRL